MERKPFHEITPAIEALAEKAQAADVIDSSLYVEHDVKRGLRDLNGFLPHTMGVPENRGGPWCLEWPWVPHA